MQRIFDIDRNPSRSMDTTILNLLSWLCPTSLLTVFANLSLSVKDLTTRLIDELCQLVIVLRSKRLCFHKVRMMSETNNQTSVCVTHN